MTAKRKDKGISRLFANSTELSVGQSRVFHIFLYTMLTATIVTLIGILLFYIYSLSAVYHGVAKGPSLWLLGIFSDFVEIMSYALKDSPYLEGVGSSYPAIAIMVLYPFALICKGVFAEYTYLGTVDINEFTSRVIVHPEFWIALLLFFAVGTLSVTFLITRIYKFDFKLSVKTVLLVIMSAPFVYAIMRGNTIYFALIFILLFLLFYKSKNPFLRELSYICLAIAGCIKIYPLFFGVFLLKDKKLFASFRVAMYFCIIFFSSFYLFSGTGGDADPFFENLNGFMGDAERLACYRNLSITALLYKIVHLFSPAATAAKAFTIVNLVILGTVFTLATVTATATKNKLSRSMICAAVVILIPPVSYYYVLVFTVIPFMEYIMSYDSLSRAKQAIYGGMFMFLMLTPLLIPQIYIPNMLIISTMAGMETVSVIKNEMLPYFKNKKAAKKTKAA